MIPDPLSRTVRIPIKIVNGHLCLAPKGSLPILREGAICELTVLANAFVDRKVAAQFTEECTESFLPAGTKLIAQINPEHVPNELRNSYRAGGDGYVGAGVEFLLKEDQKILKRGAKSAKLLPCECSIPSIDKEARSINHAYTLISEAYEPDRMSRTGNVFSKVLYRAAQIWKPLKHLRGY